jgi:dUTP pyrophosphatase
MNLKIKLLSKDAYMPTRGTSGSAGIDFYTPKDIVISPKNDLLVPLDIAMKIPEGMFIMMKEKSGLALNKKIIMGASVIDSDYRGNCHAHLFNLSDDNVIFEKGEKICQGILMNYYSYIGIKQVEKLNNTERAGGGFGSTGKR